MQNHVFAFAKRGTGLAHRTGSVFLGGNRKREHGCRGCAASDRSERMKDLCGQV